MGFPYATATGTHLQMRPLKHQWIDVENHENHWSILRFKDRMLVCSMLYFKVVDLPHGSHGNCENGCLISRHHTHGPRRSNKTQTSHGNTAINRIVISSSPPRSLEFQQNAFINMAILANLGGILHFWRKPLGIFPHTSCLIYSYMTWISSCHLANRKTCHMLGQHFPNLARLASYPFGFVWKCWVNLPNEIAIFHDGIMISKTIGYNGVHNIFRHTHVYTTGDSWLPHGSTSDNRHVQRRPCDPSPQSEVPKWCHHPMECPINQPLIELDVGQNGRPMWDHRCECLV